MSTPRALVAESIAPVTRSPLLPCGGIVLALGAIVMVQPIFAVIANSFDLPTLAVRVSFSWSTLAYAVAFFLFGPLTDRLSLTRMGLTSAVGLAVSVALAGLAPGFVAFNVGMVLMGGFAAGLVSSMFPYMTRIAPPGQAGRYLGLCLSATVSGIIFGRTALGVLTHSIGWRMAMVGYAALVLALALWFVRLPSLPTIVAARPSLAGQYARALQLLTTPRVTRRYVAGFLLFFAYLGVLTFLTFYLAAPPFGLSVAQIGWISLAGLGGAVIAPKAGALAQRHGAAHVVRIGVMLVIGSFAILLLLPHLVAVVAGVLLLYAGVYACQPAVFYDVTTAIEPQQMGAASSLYLLSCLSGGSFGSWALGPIWQRWGWTGVMLAAGAAALATLLLGAVGDTRRAPGHAFT